MTAALLSFWLSLAVGAWHSRAVWRAPGEPVKWRAWLAHVIPLTLGLGTTQFMMSADQLLVQSIFDKEVTGLYGAAGMIGRALVIFTTPMLAVMFPKVVASAARSEKTEVLAHALGATALLGGAAALGCTLFPALPLRIVYGKEYWGIAPLVPWFAWCMLPLTLANVLIGNLLARGRFAAVPWLVIVAGGYGAALLGRAEVFQQAEQFAAFKWVVVTIGGFSLLLLGVAVWFTFRREPGGASHSGLQAPKGPEV
jgi:O-antigen/teichoic acid export membrane protein